MAARKKTTPVAETRQSRIPTIASVLDYMFGRNALIGFASLMLLVISGYATWSGMSDFIVGVSTASPTGRQIPGGLSVTNDMLVIAIVVALTFLMWLALRESFGAGRTLRERLVTFPLYAFLALWSIGFGYGFWWSLIAGEEATRTGLAGLQEDARNASTTVTARLDAVKAQLDNVVGWSESQMAREESSGGSCGIASGAGRGPLYNARASVRDSVASLRDGIEQNWIAPVQADVERLKQAAAGLDGGTIEERQRLFEEKAALVRSSARSIAARSNQLGKATAAEMRALADSVSVQPREAGFSCYDPTLAQRLRQAANQAGEPAELRLREAVFNEGPAGVANAVKNLWANLGAYFSGLATYVASGGTAENAWTESGEPITGRDMIALLATIGVDLGLFVLTVLNPPKTPPSRLPSGGVIAQIQSAMRTAIARAPGADIEWVRRHFIYHNQASYFVIPNLFSCDPNNKEESAKALAMNQLAGVLDDMDLVEWPNPAPSLAGIKLGRSEIEKLRREELGTSGTDLTEVRKARLKELEGMIKIAKTDAEKIKLDQEKAKQIRMGEPIRNHGLFSKAEHMLEITGWSENAQKDFEIYRLVDREGLTPLLHVLNEWDETAGGAVAGSAAEESGGASSSA